MSTSLRYSLTRAAVLTALTTTARAQTADPLAARVDSIATRVLAATGVPSASVAVVRHDSVVYARAYGLARLDPRTPATSAMRYGIGSISKRFTAAAVLLLRQEGKLSLDDPVERWVPGLTRGRDMTLRMLTFANGRTLRVWTFETPDGKLEQYQVAPVG